VRLVFPESRLPSSLCKPRLDSTRPNNQQQFPETGPKKKTKQHRKSPQSTHTIPSAHPVPRYRHCRTCAIYTLRESSTPLYCPCRCDYICAPGRLKRHRTIRPSCGPRVSHRLPRAQAPRGPSCRRYQEPLARRNAFRVDHHTLQTNNWESAGVGVESSCLRSRYPECYGSESLFFNFQNTLRPLILHHRQHVRPLARPRRSIRHLLLRLLRTMLRCFV
jgi:hypothetical protein